MDVFHENFWVGAIGLPFYVVAALHSLLYGFRRPLHRKYPLQGHLVAELRLPIRTQRTGFYAKGLARNPEADLILQGAGNHCRAAENFTHRQFRFKIWVANQTHRQNDGIVILQIDLGFFPTHLDQRILHCCP